jgi:hypothetical protein
MCQAGDLQIKCGHNPQTGLGQFFPNPSIGLFTGLFQSQKW